MVDNEPFVLSKFDSNNDDNDDNDDKPVEVGRKRLKKTHLTKW